MEERPSVGATIPILLSFEAENGSDRSKLSVNNDQSFCQLQDEETQTKKTENGKLNGSIVEGEDSSLDSESYLHSVSRYGDKVLLESNLKRKPSGQALNAALKGEGKGNNTSRNSMDYKNDKPSELITHEGKKEALASLNGVVSLNCGPLTNGYPGKPGIDNDGSGSESGYTTPKKRRAQRNGKAVDNVTVSVQGKAMPYASKQDPGPAAQELSDRTLGSQVDLGHSASKADGQAGGSVKAREPPTSAISTQPTSEVQRKNSDGKALGKKYENKSSKLKVAASAKEDSWTLFKPPPVFPVDNSSAKIVPKISYASKVKENLKKTTQAGGEALSPAPQVPGRPSQVPMSAVKTITSASFTNGPLVGEGNGCPLPGTPFSSMASSALMLASSSASADNVASLSGSSSTTTTTLSMAEPRKPNLFVYPLTQSSMQLTLPSGRQADPPAPAANQKSLGDIFQNQWGLSFINEPSAGPEGLACRATIKDTPAEVSFQGGCPASSVATQISSTSQRLDQPHFPKACELDKRTSTQTLSRDVNLALPEVRGSTAEGSLQASSLEMDLQKDEVEVPSAIVFSSSKDIGAETTNPSPAAPKLFSAREQGHTKGFDRRSSWGLFDLKAAVVYHTKEMEYILTLQKQDPNRVVLYSESKNGPDQ